MTNGLATMNQIIKIDDNFEHASSIENLIATENRDIKYQVHDALDKYSAPFNKVFSKEAKNILDKESENIKLDRRTGASFLNEVIPRPSLEIYKLSGAHLFGGKIISKGNGIHTNGQLCLRKDFTIFSQSYGIMDGMKTLSNILLKTENKDEYNLGKNFGSPQEFKGNYFLIGNVHVHFGHFLVEGLARLWALKYISEETIPDLKFVIYENGLTAPARKIFEYLGINNNNIVFCPEYARFENIYIPSVGMRTHWWCHKAMNFLYDKISDAAFLEKPNASYPEKILLSRRDISNRSLLNIKEFESFFSDRGYSIIRPESLPIGDQIRMCANASSIVGCTGSQMYLALFQKRDGKNIVFTPWNFSIKDDAMISDIRASKLTYILGSKMDSSGCWQLSISDELLKNV